MYKLYAAILGGRTGVKTGPYAFDKPQSSLKVAFRTVNGILGLTLIKVTIIEGSATPSIAKLLGNAIPDFDSAAFLLLAKPHEGYLFPDTYYFTAADTATTVMKDMTDNFSQKEKSISAQFSFFRHSESDVIKMASIIEKEATSSVDRRIIAGILWKRLESGMPLQVDPPFYYILNKTSGQLTLDDLKTISPYNLYINKGLPPTPIDNPGLSAITDALNPTSTKFWYYLSDNNGVMHYTTTYDQHLANKAKYLN